MVTNRPSLKSEPLISPSIVSDTILSKFPPTVLIAGDVDPLIDDSQEMFNRLCNAGVHCKFKIYRALTHGFLNLPTQIPRAYAAIDDCARYIKWLAQNALIAPSSSDKFEE